MSKTSDPPGPPATRRETAWLALGIATYTGVFTVLAVLRYRSLFAYEWGDLAGINHLMWSTTHGRPFFQSVTEQYFMGHFQPILALLAVPYWIAPNIATLLFFGALAPALGAVPVFLLARRALGPRAGLIWAWAYLLYSPLHNVTLTDFRPVVLAIPLLLAALYAFERERFGWFVGWCVGVVLCQENLGLCVALLAGYAVCRRRPWKWAVTPLVLGVAWFALCTRVLMPMFFRDVAYPFGGYLYLWIGNQPASALVRKILHNPYQYAMLLAAPSRLLLLLKCFWPLCFLPLAAPLILLVPAASWFQLLAVHHSAIHAVRVHWLAAMIPTFFFAAILGARRAQRWLEYLQWAPRTASAVRRLIVIAPLAACAVSNVTPNLLHQQSGVRPIHRPDLAYARNLFDPAFYRCDEEDRTAWRAMATVPADASVSASGDLLPALSHRARVIEFGFTLQYLSGRERDDLDADYIVLHARCESHGASVYAWPGIRRLRDRVRRMMRTGMWEPVFMEGSFLVLRRVREGSANHSQVEAALRHLDQYWSDEAAARHPGGLSDLARSAYEDGDVAAAVSSYQAMARMSPHDPYPCRKAGEILWQMGRRDESLPYFEMANRRAPLCLATCMAFGRMLAAARQPRLAERQFERAIRLLPTDAEPYAALGMICFGQKRLDRAERLLRRAIRLDPGFTAARKLHERCVELRAAP